VCAASINSEVGLRSHTLFDELPQHVVHHRVRLLPLRERREDIPHLCEYLLEKLAGDFGRPVPHLSSHAVEAFQQWKWPGNIRELENWIARIVLFGAEEVLGLEFRRRLPPEEDFHRVAHMRVGRSRRLRRHR
jgi:transcriptional regulator with PAS, ATPase and Fis domain